MNVHFSSKTVQWATPQDFFDKLNQEFDFNLDPCADASNAKCKKFFTEEQDGLKQNWDGYRVFCNPPYGTVLKEWVKKASEAQGGGSRDVNTFSNRYKIFSRVYLSKRKCRDQIFKRSFEVWKRNQFRTLSKHGSNF